MMNTDIAPTHCAICGRGLTDPDSVERGIGPECSSKGYPTGGTANHAEARMVIRFAAVAADQGNIDQVRLLADQVEKLGYPQAAQAIRKRWENADRQVKIRIKDEGNFLLVVTPFKRSMPGFMDAWRKIPGRSYRRGANVIPKSSRRELWELFKQFFPKVYGKYGERIFRIPESR